MTLHDNKTAFTLLSGIEVMPANDQIAIGRTLRALLAGFACCDVSVLEGVYSDDADWVNAFGTVKSRQRANSRLSPRFVRRRRLQSRAGGSAT